MTTETGHLRLDWQKSIFRKIAESISETMNLPVSIWALNETGDSLVIHAAIGLPQTHVRNASLKLTEQTVTGQAFKSGELVFVRDVLNTGNWKYKDMAQEMGWKSVLCVPVKVRQVVIAVVSVYTFVEKEFTEIEKRLVSNYVSQIEFNLEIQQNQRVLKRLMSVSEGLQRLVTESPRVIYQEIVKTACELTGAECAVLYPYDYQRNDFFEIDAIVDHGLLHPLAVKEKPRSKTGMAAHVRQQGEIIYNDIEKEKPDLIKNVKFIAREQIKAFMGISLQMGEEVLGVLYVNYRSPHKFMQEESDLIRLFAYQAAIAIYSARLYSQSEARAGALRKLHDFSPTLVTASSSNEDLGIALDRIRENAIGVLGADRVELYQYSHRKNALFLARNTAERPDCLPIPIADFAFLQPLILERRASYLSDTAAVDAHVTVFNSCLPQPLQQRFAIHADAKSLAVVPIIVGQEVFGVMLVSYLSTQTFPQSQKELIELFANIAAVAIHNGRLSGQRKILQDTSRDLTQITDPEQLLNKLLDQSLKLFGCEIGSICEYDKATNRLVFSYSKGKGNFQYVEMGHGLIGRAAESREIVYVPDVREDPRYVEHASETRSELDIPLIIGDELIGVLNAESTRLDGFRPTTREMAQVLANHAAVGIYNARLYEKTVQRLEQRLNDISAFGKVYEAVGADPLGDVLRVIVEQSVSLTGSDYGTLWEINRDDNQLQFRVEVSGLNEPVDRIETIKLKGSNRVGSALLKGQTYLLKSAEDTALLHPEKQFASGLIVPLKLRGKLVGALELQSLQKDTYDEDQIRLLETLAAQAADAIQDAKVYQQLSVLVQISRSVNPMMEQREILQLMLEKALEAVNAKTGTIHLVNRTTGMLEIKARSGQLIEEDRPDVLLNPGEGVTGWVVQNNHYVLTGDVTKLDQENGPKFVQYLEGTQSELAVPIRYKDRVLGALNAESPLSNAFDENDLQLFEAIASQAAEMIHTAAQYRAMRAINQVASELAHTINRPENEVLELIHTHTSALMDANNLYIALYDETLDSETGQMVGTVRFGLAYQDGQRVDVENDENWKWRIKGKGRTEEIIDTRERILIKTQKESDAWYDQPGHKEYLGKPYASWLGVPMLVADRVIGVIAVSNSTREYVYDEEDLEVLTAMAALAAVALDNSYRHYKIELGYESLIELGEALNTSIHVGDEELLELMRVKAGEKGLIDTSNMFIALYDEDKDEVRFILSYENGEKINLEEDIRWHPRVHGTGRTEEIIRSGSPILIRTRDEAASWYQKSNRKEYLKNPVTSWIGVPMKLRDKVVGVVVVFHKTQEFLYTQDDQTLLQAMANQAAVALENARLYTQTRDLLQQTRGELIASRQLAALGTAVAALHHRINNSSSIILPNVARLRRRLDPNDTVLVEILDIIERNAKLTAEIISRLQTPLQEMDVQQTNINAILQEKIKEVEKNSIQGNPDRTGITIAFQPDDRIPIMKTPIGQLSEVFKNLIDNAVRAMQGPGCIEVSSLFEPFDANRGTIYVRVRDTGTGIPPKIAERLFTKPVPNADPTQGAGLGLWINNLILKSLNGAIKIESTGSSGTTILVTLPTPEEPKEGRL